MPIYQKDGSRYIHDFRFKGAFFPSDGAQAKQPQVPSKMKGLEKRALDAAILRNYEQWETLAKQALKITLEEYAGIALTDSLGDLLAMKRPMTPGVLENIQISPVQYCELRTRYAEYSDFQGAIVYDYSLLDASEGVIKDVLTKKLHKGFKERLTLDSYPLANVRLSAEQVRVLMDKKHKDFRGAILTDLDLTEMNLAGCDFTDAYLRGSNFSDCTGLNEINLVRANIRNCIFNVEATALPMSWRVVCNKTGVILRDLSHENLSVLATLSSESGSLLGVKLNLEQFAHLIKQRRKDFMGVVLTGLDLKSVGSLKDLDLTHACLDGSDLTGIIFNKVDLRYASAIGAIFNKCTFNKGSLELADCEAASFDGAGIRECSTEQTNFRCTRFTGVFFQSTGRTSFFEGANLTGTGSPVMATQDVASSAAADEEGSSHRHIEARRALSGSF